MVTISVPSGTSGSGAAAAAAPLGGTGGAGLRAARTAGSSSIAAAPARALASSSACPTCQLGGGACVWHRRSIAEASSPSPRIMAIGVLTATSLVPSGTRILPSVPSSTASTSMVALSVSISAIDVAGFDRVALLLVPLGEVALLHRGRERGHQDFDRHRRITCWRPSGRPREIGRHRCRRSGDHQQARKATSALLTWSRVRRRQRP
mgnify:CR=1 FL=1